MLILSALFFLVAALLGFYLISFILQNKETPKGIVFIHGPLAVIGLILLLFYALLYNPTAWVSIIIFLLAAALGFTMIYRDLTGKTLPKWLAISHGVIAFLGFAFLLYILFS